MPSAYLIGQIRIKNAALWERYRCQVGATLTPWGGELVFRGQKRVVFSGEQPRDDVVVISFPDPQALANWHASAAYQALIPLREQAADVLLVGYDA